MKRRLLFIVLTLLFSASLWAQQRAIKGKVTSQSDGQPMAGVSVVVKGTTNGTQTDGDGNYTIDVESGKVLQFSSVGYKIKEVTVKSGLVINIQLEDDQKQLGEVVVTALGISRKERSLGYSTQKVNGDNLTLTKEQNVLGSLAGKISGVQVVGSSGASMGGTQSIKIRGVNSISGNDQALIVVDGTPVSNDNYSSRTGRDYGNIAQDINPEDIESVNVLKGPAASALYGMRGQYGVIMITTKKGAKDKTKVEFSSSYSIDKAFNFMPVQNLYGGGASQTFPLTKNGEKMVDTKQDMSWGPKMDGTPVRQFYSFYPQDADYGKLTPFVPQPNNIQDYYNTGTTANNNISITGGNEKLTFRMSYNNTNTKGVEPNTYLRRNNLSVSGDVKASEKISFNANINFANNKGQRPGQGSEDGSRYMNQWFQRSLDMNKLRNYKYSDGTYGQWSLSNWDDPSANNYLKALYWNNPYFAMYENPSHDSRNRFFGNAGISYQVLPTLKLTGTVRGDTYTQNFDSRTTLGGTGTISNSFAVAKYENREMNYEFLAQYKKQFGNFDISANAGANLYTVDYSSLTQSTAGGLSSPNFFNIAASIDKPIVTNSFAKKQVRSFYGLASIGYKDIYFLDVTLRNDISSTLPQNNNSYYYPSVSFSAVFGDLLKWEPLSYGKVRVSYAKAGSDVAPYQTANPFAIDNTAGTMVAISLPNTYFTEDLMPAYANSFEVGTDLKFLNNRLGLNITYYDQKNKNQVITLSTPSESGYTSLVTNAGNISNKGFEASLSATPIKLNKFSWDVSANISRNKSKIIELHPQFKTYTLETNSYSSISQLLIAEEGKSFGSLITTGIKYDPATGKMLLDANNLPVFEANQNFGTMVPDFTGGLQNTFKYKNFALSASIDFQGGGQFFSRTKLLSTKTGIAVETAAINENGKNVRDPLAEGGGVKVNGISAATGQEVTAFVDSQKYYTAIGTKAYNLFLYDASYIKLREVRLGYTFSKKEFAKLPASSVNLAFTVRNPLMIWQKAPKGLDPSELSSGSSGLSWNESGELQSVRSFGLNLNVSF